MAQANTTLASSALLTSKQVATMLSVTTKTLERWRGVGYGPLFVRLSHVSVRYRAEDVRSFIDARVCRSTAA